MGKKGNPRPKEWEYEKANEAAEAQAQSSLYNTLQQTYANRPTQSTPWGESSWNAQSVIDPSTGKPVTAWENTLSLNPQEQAALNLQQGANINRSQLGSNQSEYALNVLGSAPEWNELGELGQYQAGQLPQDLNFEGAYEVGDPDRYREDAYNTAYESGASRLDPMFEQREQAQDIRLRSQGLVPGDEAYDTAMGNLGRDRTDAYDQLQRQAFQTGGDEATRQQALDMSRRGMDVGEIGQQAGFNRESVLGQSGLNLGQANYENTLRQQQIAEQAQRRGITLNEMNALLTGAQVGTPSMPGFNTATKGETTNYMGAQQMANEAALNRYNAKAGAFGAGLEGVGSLLSGGGALYGAFGG